MSPRRRRSSPQCKDCHRPVLFFRSILTSKWRPFEPKPIRPGQLNPAPAYPVENNTTWWPYRDLVEDLMMRHHCSQADAEDEAHAMPWYQPHDCPNRPRKDEPQ